MILHNKKAHVQKRFFIAFFSILIMTIIGTGMMTQAANDDPGKGRLSGEYIAPEFYDNSELTSYKANDLSFTSYSPYTDKTYTHQATYRNRKIYHGIDVSQWQGVIDWKKVKADGISYAFIRVGGRGYSAGNLFKDTYFETNMKNASAAGIKIGVYIFSQAITTSEAVEEANYILSNIKGYNVTMPIIIDYEYADAASDGGRLKVANLTPAEATNVCIAFCNKIKSAGYTPMVYANKYMLEQQMIASNITNRGYKIWLANYTTNTSYTGRIDYWQYSSEGKVNGIAGNVDMNFYYGPRVHAKYLTCDSIPNQKYTGKYLQPDFNICYKDTKLTRNVDYTLSYSNNGLPGTATVTITGIGNFYGTKTVNFIILPRTVTGITTTAKSTNSVSFKWGDSVNATGYQIYRSTCVDGTYTPVKMMSARITSYTDTGLNEGQCYYYKVRSFITINSKKYWSEYSNVIAINTRLGHTRVALSRHGTPLFNKAASGATMITRLDYLTIIDVFYVTRDKQERPWYYVKATVNGTTYRGYIPIQMVITCKLGQISNKDYGIITKYPGARVRFTYLTRNQKVYIFNTRNVNGTPWYQIYFIKHNKGYVGWISSKECAIK